jgi:spore germination cell wall hydrolase CwlJ-like protein
MKSIIKFIPLAVLLCVSTLSQAGQARGLFTEEDKPEMWCLAQNIYYEARGSNRADRMAVADVVINRVQHTYYPNTICEVVKQGKKKPSWKDPNKMVMVRNACQFSWYCDGKADIPQDMDAWVEAQQIAYNMLIHSDARGVTEGATHYHADYVSPNWAKDFHLVGRIGVHIFYRWDK